MSGWIFYGAYRSWYATDFVHTTAWRFIGADENDGQRWTVGDEIDLFWIDTENEEFKDNPGFVLEGATQLVVGGVILLTSAFLM